MVLPVSNRSRRNYGGIMIEAMLTLFLFATCGITCISLLMSSAVSSQRAVENNAAYNAARQVIENVRLYEGNKIVARDYDQEDVLAIGAVPQLTQLNGSSVSMRVLDWTPRPGVKYVRVTVRWTGRGGTMGTKQRVLTSLVAERGVTE